MLVWHSVYFQLKLRYPWITTRRFDSGNYANGKYRASRDDTQGFGYKW
jgi:hypothetical protein